MTPQEIISDDEIARVHGNANFGAMDPREVVNDGVRKTAVGYHCGSTQLHILRDHGLVTKPRSGSSDVDLTKKGKAYARSIYRDTTPARAEAQDEGAAGEIVGDGMPIGEGFLYRTTMTGERHIVHEATGFTIAKLPYDYRYTDNATQKALADKIVALYAHPSPTPAADADRVRIAVEALERAADRINVTRGPMGSFYRTESSAESLYEAKVAVGLALAALKSTAAKEGGAK